ncbi:MAG: NUDIX domain-containing protein [Desulfobacteraceae bacterium]|nr:MAG: NUDIX domain-containing protein [Desulfobacteraceae bacterium]
MNTSNDVKPSDSLPQPAYPDHPRLAVGAVVFKDNRVLLVQRGNPPGQGQWAIPGGSVRLGETLQQAAEREIFEETGIVIHAREPVLTFDVVDRDADGRVRFHYVIVDLAADYLSGELLAGDDATAARWVAADDLRTLPVNVRTRALLQRQFQFGSG